MTASATEDRTAAAVTTAQDAWATKLARITARKPIERSYTLHDEDLDAEAEELNVALGEATARARKAAEAAHDGMFEKDAAAYHAAVEKSIKLDPDVVRARKAHEKAEKAARAADIVIPLRSIGSKAWSDLIELYPPTEAGEKLGHEYNIDRFPPALIAACAIDPMTIAEAASIVGGEAEVPVDPSKPDGEKKWVSFPGVLPQGEASLLFALATGINTGSRSSVGKD